MCWVIIVPEAVEVDSGSICSGNVCLYSQSTPARNPICRESPLMAVKLTAYEREKGSPVA